VDLFGLVRVTWLPRRQPADPIDAPVRADATPGTPEGVVRSLIGLADDLAGLAERAAGENAAGESAAGSALRLAQWRVGQVLAECGVQPVRDEGPVEPARHEVVGVRPAGPDGSAGWIAATVRPGYMADGQLIRPQQVVAYAASATGTSKGSGDARRG
jgi:molecular chaperone GrpE (heat shock protein)